MSISTPSSTSITAYGLEFTPRFGYDASASIFSTLDSGLGDFLWGIASGETDLEIRTRARWAASTRYSIPPYPEEVKGKHPKGVPIKEVNLEDAWTAF